MATKGLTVGGGGISSMGFLGLFTTTMPPALYVNIIQQMNLIAEDVESIMIIDEPEQYVP
jgi:hypothetical protein